MLKSTLRAAAVVAAAAAVVALAPHPARARPEAGRKVVLIGLGGTAWADIKAAGDSSRSGSMSRMPALGRLIDSGSVANVSFSITNRTGDGYLTLGTGERSRADANDALAFNAGEQVENGPAEDAFKRYTGRDPAGEVLVLPAGIIAGKNEQQGLFIRPGFLADSLAKLGMKTAVVGNADLSSASLPSVLPRVSVRSQTPAPETGIHREAALAAMGGDGSVDFGNVGRDLLEPDPTAPYGIATSPAAFETAFRKAYAKADLVVVETGDPARADLYSAGLPQGRAAALRAGALRKADRLMAAVTRHTEAGNTLVIVASTTTPGGPAERGRLRPVVAAGPGIEKGFLTSSSTRRRGLVTAQDLSATIAAFLGASQESFGNGHAVRSEAASGDLVGKLIYVNDRVTVNDKMRFSFSLGLIVLDLFLFPLGLFFLRKGGLPVWLKWLMVAAVAFPLMTHLSKTPIWQLGTVGSGAVIIVASMAVAGFLVMADRSSLIRAAWIIPAAGALFFMVDLAAGAPAQLDTIFGYTSVSGARFYGIGNLGFAMFAASILMLAGMIAERDGYWRWVALGAVGLASLWAAAPQFGADVGGTLAMIPVLLIFGVGLIFKRRIPWRRLPAVALAGFAVVAVLGLIELARPVSERTHLGNFFAGWIEEPGASAALLRRKIVSSATFGILPWGLVIPATIIVLVVISRRYTQLWQGLIGRRPYFRTTLEALIAAAIGGSVFNDSGVTVGGMVLALAVPWVFLLASQPQASTPVVEEKPAQLAGPALSDG